MKLRSHKKTRKKIVFENLYKFWQSREKSLDAFESQNILNPDHSKLKVLTPQQMLERFSVALAQVKVGNNSESC